ncbi:tumor necrosis factor a (TNF superfamily, member 2) [Centropristis striata]|uniref:tumor necrosis factor a (TNF superfamily, member 2) n=1 Tax=Centropristis striata TaxID=184440 RepID=UPI0027DFCBA3|nr:tumor necrosis factor a (TNF superfamily, member 2) [Centropristis striata]
MEGEHKVQMDNVDTEARKQTSLPKPSSKVTTALLVFTLCLAAAAAALLVFNRQTKALRQDEDNFDLRHTLRQISNDAEVRAAIHLEGEYNRTMKTSVEWKPHQDQYHARGGLKLENNEIVIPRNGLYFVYSQASFRVNCSSNDVDPTALPLVHLSHTVKRWSSIYGDNDAKKSYHTILHSVRTACQVKASSDADEDGSWFSAVYMGAVFDLKAKDRLKTVMEEKMLLGLEDEPGKTFFGVFAL